MRVRGGHAVRISGHASTCFCVKRNQNNSRCTYLCNVSRVLSATWRMQKIKVYGAQLVLSRISHQLFFHQFNFIFHLLSFSRNDFNFPARFQLSFSTLTFSHDFNFPARLQLSSTTLTFRHDVNFPTVLQWIFRQWIFFRPYFHYCLSSAYYCEDHFHSRLYPQFKYMTFIYS